MLRATPRRWRPRRTYCAGPWKRTFDLVVAAVLSLLTLPVVVALAVASALSFRAWPFFVQERMGRGGRPFRFVKIRSLPPTAPRYADKYALADVRTSRFGTVLRASHLDELPQLWLVLAGRMSLVGPRPEMAAVAAHFDPGFVAARTSIRPGCTGPWQVSEASDRLIGEDPRYDLLYLHAATFTMDVTVLVRTFTQLLGARPLAFEELEGSVGSVGELAGHRRPPRRGTEVIDVTDAAVAAGATGAFADLSLRGQLLSLFDDGERLATAVD